MLHEYFVFIVQMTVPQDAQKQGRSAVIISANQLKVKKMRTKIVKVASSF